MSDRCQVSVRLVSDTSVRYRCQTTNLSLIAALSLKKWTSLLTRYTQLFGQHAHLSWYGLRLYLDKVWTSVLRNHGPLS